MNAFLLLKVSVTEATFNLQIMEAIMEATVMTTAHAQLR